MNKREFRKQLKEIYPNECLEGIDYDHWGCGTVNRVVIFAKDGYYLHDGERIDNYSNDDQLETSEFLQLIISNLRSEMKWSSWSKEDSSH